MNKILSSFQTDFAKQLILLVSMEFLIFLISGVGYTSISKAPYFNIGVDPFYWIFYGLFIPQTILKYPIIASVFDFATIGLLVLSLFKFNEKWVRCLVFLLMLYYVTVTGYIGHINYQSGFVWVLMPLMFKSEKKRCLLLNSFVIGFCFFTPHQPFLKLWEMEYSIQIIIVLFLPSNYYLIILSRIWVLDP